MPNSEVDISSIIKDLQEVYEGKRLCEYYFSYFGTRYQTENESADLNLIKAVISYYMKPNDTWKPFHPFLILDARRSAIPDDLKDEEIAKLEVTYPEIQDSELKSRIADVLWLKKRDVQYAHDAVDSYIQSAKNIREESWTYSQTRIERALRLSLSLGKGGTADLEKVIKCIKEVLDKFDLEKEAYFPLKLAELLLEVNYSEIDYCISILEQCVTFFEGKKDFYRLNDYLEILAKWLDKKGEKDKAKEKRILIAENHVKSQENEASYMGKVHVLQKAIEVYRQIGGQRERIDQLNKNLLEIQEKIPEEMKTFEGPPIDISQSVEASIAHVSNHSKKDALFRFCFITRPVNSKETFDHVEQQTQKFIHTSLFGKTTVNNKGRTIAHTAGLIDSTPSREDRLYPHLVDHMGISWGLSVKGAILPALQQIMIEYDVTDQDLEEFVKNNPLIRPGHEGLFLQGISYGFQGKFDLAGNILVIQFEDSLRFLLEKKGILTSNIQSDFTQEERGTAYFFQNNTKELKEIFGDDIFYELKALLVKDESGNGFNLRNLIAHGLMTSDEFYSAGVIYFWWLLFRFLCTPVIRANGEKTS